MQGAVLSHQAVLPEGMEHLIDPAQGDAAHQSSELLSGAQGPGSQQVEGFLLRTGQMHREGRCELLGRLWHGGLHAGGVQSAGVRLRVVTEEGIGRLQ